jgi:hypothetical protein
VRLIGVILLLAGVWSVWKALVGEEPLGAGGLLMAIIGALMLTRPGRALAAWIGQGIVTGLCIIGGLLLFAFGVLMLLAYWQVLAEGMAPPARSWTVPALFLGCGLLLLVVGLRRLWRFRGLPQ